MTKEQIAILGLLLSLFGVIFGFGVRMGALTERIETQSKQLDLVSQDLRAINRHFILWSQAHQQEGR